MSDTPMPEPSPAAVPVVDPADARPPEAWDLLRRVARFDDAVDAQLDRVRGHPTIDRLMYGASELGDFSLIWHLVGAAQAAWPGRDPMDAVRFSAIMGAESALVNGGIKSLFRRARPTWAEEDRGVRPHRLRTPMSSSFPSGHASSAFTAAVVLSQGSPLWPVYFGTAAVVATSRMYVKIHHASDVVAGAALGLVLGTAIRRVWPRR